VGRGVRSLGKGFTAGRHRRGSGEAATTRPAGT
jgi:hypothetical protein